MADQKRKADEEADNADLDEGIIKSAGVGITEGELRAVDDLAAKHGASRNALMRLAVRLFIENVRAGRVNLEEYFVEPERPRRRSKIGKHTRS
jgi:hypothetical protein